MSLHLKNAEYLLMINSEKRTIRVTIPDGPTLVCYNSWDYRTDLTKTSLMTKTELTQTHPLLKIEPVDLNPVTTTKVWRVTILRQPESNLKDEKGKRKRMY